MPYSFFSSSEGNSTASRLVTTTSYELSDIGKRTILNGRWYNTAGSDFLLFDGR